MDNNITKTEEVLMQALELQEKGVSLLSITQTYPEHAAEIRDMFAALGKVADTKLPFKAPEEGLRSILKELPTPVITAPVKSPFWKVTYIAQWKLILPILALVVVGGGIALNNNGGATPIDTPVIVQTTTPTPSTAKTLAVAPAATAKELPPATGDIDEFAAVLASEGERESTIAARQQEERAAVTSDKESVQGISQPYEKQI